MALTPQKRTRLVESVSYVDLDDGELIALVAKSDQLALKEIFKRNAPMLVATAVKVTRSKSLAEEIVQEIFVRLWSNPTSFDKERGSLRSFLLVQAHRRSIDAIRSEEARAKREKKVLDIKETPPSEVDEIVMGRQGLQSLKLAMADLSDDERLAIELAYIHGHTYHEVAVILHLADGTIKSRIRSGLRKIREALELNPSGGQNDGH